jgi:hypothetical protein
MPGKNHNPNGTPMGHGFRPLLLILSTLALCLSAQSQTCQTSSDLDDAARSALTAAGRRFFDFAAKGDVAALRQNAAPALASDFSAIEALVKDHQLELAAAQVTPKSVFLLEAEGGNPLPHAEFYCGVFGKNGQTSGSAVFSLDNLVPGKYAVVILEAVSPQSRNNFSEILQQVGTDWKLAGLQFKAIEAAGRDSDWFAARARGYKAKSQLHNAWLFYLQARSLVSPVSFMSTLATDKLYDEFQSLQPADLPTEGKPVDLIAGNTTYKLTALFPSAVGNDLDLIVRYRAPDVSNTSQANQNNLAVIKALIAKYPEFKNAFAGVVARAVDPSGHDFGTLLAMKDIK